MSKKDLQPACLRALEHKNFPVGKFELYGIGYGPNVGNPTDLARARCPNRIAESSKKNFEVMHDLTGKINKFAKKIGVGNLIRESLDQHGKYFPGNPCEACRYAIFNLMEDFGSFADDEISGNL